MIGAQQQLGRSIAPARPSRRSMRCAATGNTAYGIFVCSASPAVAEGVASSGLDWMCLDAQHGAVTYETLNHLLCATSSYNTKRIVRVAGPWDRAGMQQALECAFSHYLGADGVMVPLVECRADAQQAVSSCLFPPAGQRSVAYPVRAVYRKGVGAPALARYLQDANKELEVWLQVETRSCYESLDHVLSVPGITCAFLGPADMGFSYNLHIKNNYDLTAMLTSSDLDELYRNVVQACKKHKIASGVFCIGAESAQRLANLGYDYVAFDTDLGALINYTSSSQAQLKAASKGTDS